LLSLKLNIRVSAEHMSIVTCIRAIVLHEFLPVISVLLADADVRLARRIRRDTVERGRDINSVLEQASTLVHCSPIIIRCLKHTLHNVILGLCAVPLPDCLSLF